MNSEVAFWETVVKGCLVYILKYNWCIENLTNEQKLLKFLFLYQSILYISKYSNMILFEFKWLTMTSYGLL